MFRLNFSTKVLGPVAADFLREKLVTQTIRAPRSGIVGELLHSKLAVGSTIEVALDGESVGEAVITWCDRCAGEYLNLDDARLGGFETISDLEKALKRAGYRFMSFDKYNFYRVRFRW